MNGMIVYSKDRSAANKRIEIGCSNLQRCGRSAASRTSRLRPARLLLCCIAIGCNISS